MQSEKKITKEDTWRSSELRKHIQGQDEEHRRRERSKREETPRKQRSGESTDRRHRDGERDERREREKQRERDGARERAKHREPERDREEERRRDERERRKERDGERRGSERRADRDEKENRDREKERQRERYKDRDREGQGDLGRHGEKERERLRDRDREERDRLKNREREREKERFREKEGEQEKHKEKEKERDKDRERERRRAERERERRKEKEGSRDGEEKHREKDKERERERRERHREREERHRDEEQERRERERREKHGHRENSGHADREERRERRRREKERHEAGERDFSDARDTERRQRRQEGERTRDREERDKRREKRHEESKKSSTDQRHGKSESKNRSAEHEVENEGTEDDNEAAEEYGNDEYEEDFEDYEEDFEEMEEKEDKGGEEAENEEREEQRELSPRRRKEIEAIQRAMQQENELVSSGHLRPSTSRAEPPQKVSADSERHSMKGRTHGRVIDFAAARQREVNQQAVDRQKKRSAELLRLIDLDFSVTECLLDLPPVSEYDMYIKSFGMANTKQAYVQCNEDNTDRDTQTEETDSVDKWTQHPPETNVACGGPKVSQDASDESLVRMSVDSKRLTTFLRSAAQVVAVLLEENRAESSSVKKLRSQTDSLPFSDGCLHLHTKLPFLHGRQVTLLHFSQVQTHTLLSIHAPCSGSSGVVLDSKTLICVWNIWEPSAPQSVLSYEAELRCCCFSPGKATLVFAGTAVGSVVLWDLREHSGSHTSLRVDGEEWTLRHPTFSTDAVLTGAGHFSSVVSVEPVLANAEPGIRGPLLADQEESLGLSFQLGSLDENGLLNLWVVIELSKADDSGSQTDLGLRPGGKVKLLHSSSIQTSEKVTPREVTGVTPPLSLLLKFLPSDSNHYFIGTSMGLVRRGTRHGLRAVPKLYRSEDGERPAEVTALDFCPTGEPFFLVGCSDGSLRLHSVLREDPVLEWCTSSGGIPVLSVQWSKTRPSVFCVLDAASVLHVWDLTEKDSSPVITESFTTDRVTAMAVFGEAARQNRYSGVALAKQSGRLEIHFLKQSLTVPQPSDMEKLHLLARDNL
ncbi:cytoplasmic dynein 2 intermediate chain 1 isoform X2 [Pygocentrus nattereri]|uniref:cytoplasmic dynein 2 intermediate chain 1 isoform X2 n=1 Tax=Pygocentrus nattereri TaxID=42514 RepID=UPI001891D05D|nr:cytoplasmic dynein 2 intermediate chain 1 isoform X2 [Pygocentrus nattereri]